MTFKGGPGGEVMGKLFPSFSEPAVSNSISSVRLTGFGRAGAFEGVGLATILAILASVFSKRAEGFGGKGVLQGLAMDRKSTTLGT